MSHILGNIWTELIFSGFEIEEIRITQEVCLALTTQ